MSILIDSEAFLTLGGDPFIDQDLLDEETLKELVHAYRQAIKENHQLAALAKKRQEEIGLLKGRIDTLCVHDTETGLLNRRSFNRAYRREWNAALREQMPLGLAMVRVDQLEKLLRALNDTESMALIRELGQSMSWHLKRPRDLLARYDQDLFIFLLPDTTEKGTRQLVIDILAHMKDHPMMLISSTRQVPISLSFSCTGVTPQLYLHPRDSLIYLMECLERPLDASHS